MELNDSPHINDDDYGDDGADFDENDNVCNDDIDDNNLNVNFDDNNNEENSMNEDNNNNNNANVNSVSNLKRKRLCDIAYTAEITFENQQMAAQYVESLNVWKFERYRPTKKGNKGFYHCKISEHCKSKIYLLSDPFSTKVVLYQNNVEHEHDGPSQWTINAQLAKKSRTSLSNQNSNTSSHNNNTQAVDIVNDNDFEDSFVDFFDNEDNNDIWPENIDEPNEYGAQINNTNDETNNKSGLNNTFMNYSLEETFDNRQLANEYLDTVYSGLWKFERTRKTKTGAKCFYKCRLSKDCKAKCYILTMPNTDEVTLYKNNIEHEHSASMAVPANSQSSVVGVNPNVTPFRKIEPKVVHQEVVNTEDETFEYGPINCNDDYDEDDENSNEFEQNHDEAGLETAENAEARKARRRTNLVNRIELTYTPEESFETRQQANEFIESLSIWKFQRTRPTKKGAKCFYVCKLSDNCKSKIYVLSHPEAQSVTVFRNNIDHDHTNPGKLVKIDAGTAVAMLQSQPIIDKQDDIDEASPFNNAENETIHTTPNESKNNLSASLNNTLTRFEFNYYIEATFDNRFIAAKYLDSVGLWKFERNRPTKKGSKGFYHCKAESCKAKCYILMHPQNEQVTLYRNNLEHDHSGVATSGTPSSRKQPTMLRENQNSVNFFHDTNNNNNQLKYFFNNNNQTMNDQEDDYDDNTYANGSDNESENFFDNDDQTKGIKLENTQSYDYDFDQDQDSDDIKVNPNTPNGGKLNRFECVYVTDRTFDTRLLANDYIATLPFKYQRTRCTKKGAKCFYRCKTSKLCKSKMYVLTVPNQEKVILYINNIEHDHLTGPNMYNQTHLENDNLYDEGSASVADSNGDYFARQESEENFFSDDDCKSKTSSCMSNGGGGSVNSINYFADQVFDNKLVANGFVENLGLWKFDRLRDTKTGARAYWQCKISEHCKSKVYLLFHRDSEKVTLFKNNLEHDHSKKMGLKKWGLSPLTKRLIDEVYMNGNTTPMSCMLKLRAIIKAKQEAITQEKLNGNDVQIVADLVLELEQLEEPEMTVLKNYINNTLKPKLNGHSRDFSNTSVSGQFTPDNYYSETSSNEDGTRLQRQNFELTQRIGKLEQIGKKIQDELNSEREQKKNILKQLEIANNTIENLKLPNDSLINLNESNDIKIKKQQAQIDLLQQRIDELIAKSSQIAAISPMNDNNVSSKIVEKLSDVCEYF